MSRSDDRIGCRRRSREKSHNVSSFHGRKEDGRRISRPFSYPYRHSTVDLPLSSSCRRSSEYPKEQYSLTQEYDHLHHRHHQWKRQRLHSPNHVSGMRKKHKLNVNEAHCSSHLSAAECTLEIRESVSGVRSIDGSEVRHKSVKSAGDSGYGRREGGCRIERRHDKSRCDNGGHGLSGRREGEYCKECRHDGSRHYEVRHNHSGGGCGRREGGRDRECRHGSEHGGGGGGRREGGCDGIVDVDRYTASLSEPYYLTGEDKVVSGTSKLNALHQEVRELLQTFSREVPPECSFLSRFDSEGSGKMQSIPPDDSVEEKAQGKMDEVSLHENLPLNTPAKNRPLYRVEKYHSYGKSSDMDLNSTPPEAWHCYRVAVLPNTNFKFGNGISKITNSQGTVFTFQGFSILSRNSLEDIPKRTFDRYGGTYSIELLPDPIHKNYTLRDVLLFEEFLFVKLMELYDWTEYLRPFSSDIFFIPRFCHKSELLSMGDVLQHLVQEFSLLEEMDNGRSRRTEWLEGLLAVQPLKAPSCIRIDRVKRSHSKGRNSDAVVLEHCCSQLHRKARNHSMGSEKEKRRFRELQAKTEHRKLSQQEYFEFRALRHKFAGKNSGALHSSGVVGEDHVISLSQKGLYSTGFYYDLPQNVLLLPLLSQHILFIDSLTTLQDQLHYHFKDISLLHRALTHPSCTVSSYMVAEDHVRTAISNCGARAPEFIKHIAPKQLKGIKGLIEAVKEEAVKEEAGKEEAGNVNSLKKSKDARLQNNERLEFLGDAVLEYLCSHHLFINHPDYSVGKLTHERQLIIKNKNLSELAERLNLTDFLLKNSKAEFAESSASHISGNCLEAILGAVFLDGGLEEADRMFARLAFYEEEMYAEWMKCDTHPLVKQHPEGDRHLLDELATLKKMSLLEDGIGITFKHISLLAKAFVHSSCNDTSLTSGDYQRLEFLGDAILQFLASKYVYNHFPSHNEGHLSLLRTSLVHNKQLSTVCQELQFDKYIITNDTKLELSIKILADVVESFLAALTLDKGLERAEAFLSKYLYPKLKDTVLSSQLVDANTRLNQAAAFTCKQQGVGLQLPVFRIFSREGASDKPVFTIGVFLGKKKLGVGTGTTMREARSNASETALQSGLLRIPPT